MSLLVVRRIALSFCCVVAAAAFVTDAYAAEKKVTPIVPIDDDFALQGEYAGFIKQTVGCRVWTGLQIVAMGNGKFQAVEYSGGLPGNGGTMENRRKLTGATTNGVVTLTGEGRSITLSKGQKAVVADGSGHELGRLEKYHRLSHSLKQPPAPGATVLFNGSKTDKLVNPSITDDHLLNVGTETKSAYRDFVMHIEFRTPYMPKSRGQARGNSGVYLQRRYEVQVVDSFGLEGEFNEAGSLYRQHAPIVNMAFPPLSWQTYDIDFTAARFDGSGHKTANARLTLRHNGIVVQKDYQLTGKTGEGEVEGPDALPIKLQNHGNPVHYRNFWIVDKNAPSMPGYQPCPSGCFPEVVSRGPSSGNPWRFWPNCP